MTCLSSNKNDDSNEQKFLSFILLQILEDYQKYDENIELLSGIFLAADMFQMDDLQSEILTRLADTCTSDNCLDVYFVVSRFPQSKAPALAATLLFCRPLFCQLQFAVLTGFF